MQFPSKISYLLSPFGPFDKAQGRLRSGQSKEAYHVLKAKNSGKDRKSQRKNVDSCLRRNDSGWDCHGPCFLACLCDSRRKTWQQAKARRDLAM